MAYGLKCMAQVHRFAAEEMDLVMWEMKAWKQFINVPVCVTTTVNACCEPVYVGTSYYLNNVPFK